MRCTSCQSDNPPENRFCEQCGARLEARCPQCGTPVRPGGRFCGACGQRLSAPDTAVPAATPAHPYSLALALQYAAWLHQHRWEAPVAQARAEAVMVIATDQGFPLLLAHGIVLRGWALAAQ